MPIVEAKFLLTNLLFSYIGMGSLGTILEGFVFNL
jgi:hypothetical protein